MLNRSRKSTRRMIIFVAALTIAGGAGTSAYFYHRTLKSKRLADVRSAGMNAYRAGDYPAALDSLKGYVSGHRDDFDAVFAYATSRSKIELPNGKHLAESVAVFDELLNTRPGDLPTEHALLDLYAARGQWPESITLADKVLAVAKDDTTALRVKGRALAAGGKYRDALGCYSRLADLTPLDLDVQLDVRTMMQRSRVPPAEFLARALKLSADYPGDPRFQLLVAVAQYDSGNVAEGHKLLRAAATRPAPDAGFVQKLAGVFDLLKLFNEGQSVLEQAAADGKDPRALAVLVKRLWQNEKYDDVVRRLESLDATSPKTDATLVAIKAISLYALDRAVDAAPLVEALAVRKPDRIAQAWATSIKSRFDNVRDDAAAVTIYLNALSRDRDNAIIESWIGDAYAGMGEVDLAVGHWRTAADQMPSWRGPLVAASRALLSVGQPEAAVRAADEAIRRSPDSVAAHAAHAAAVYAWLESSPSATEERSLAAHVAAIQKAAPNEPETLPISVALLARAGEKEKAAAATRASLAARPALPAEALAKLLAVDRRYSLGVASEIADRMKLAATSPRSAMLAATELARGGKVDDGLTFLREAAAKSSDKSPAWPLSIAQFLETAGDARAAGEWKNLADAYPQDAVVQSTVLRAPSARADRELVQRTIDRTRKITGDDGTLWRIAKARLLLANHPSDKESSEAVGLLSDLVRTNEYNAEYRLLLSTGLMNLRNSVAAAEHLRAAVTLNPQNSAAALALADLYKDQGKLEESAKALDRAARATTLSPAVRRDIGGRLADAGNVAQAIEVLAAGGEALDPRGRLLLAELYRRRGQADLADKTFDALLAAPPVSVEAIAAAADWYASREQKDKASAALAKLDASGVAPPQRELVLAAYAEAHEAPDAAHAHFVAATKLLPNDARVWQALAQFEMRRGRMDDGLAAIDAGLKQSPDDASLVTLRLQANAVRNSQTSGELDLAPLIEALSKDSRNAAQIELLKAIQGGATTRPNESTLAQLRQAADRYPGYLPLQAMLIRGYEGAGKLDEAAIIAERAVASRPNDAAPARLAAGVYQSAMRWRDMRRAAEKWRERSLEDPALADAAIAVAMTNLHDAAAAMKQIAPHIDKAKQDPDRLAPVLAAAARAMGKLGQFDPARTLLTPLIDRSAVRSAWLDVAAQDVTPAEDARAWIEQAATKTPTESIPQQLGVVRAYHALGTRLNDPKSIDAARELLVKLCDRPDASADVWFYAGSLAAQQGDATAEADFRAAIKLNADHAEAMNDLAYLLLARGGDALKEAADLAGRAAALRPTDANIRETLARVKLAQGDRPAAISTFNDALRIDPVNLNALVGLASTLHADGQRSRAAETLKQAETLAQGNPAADDRVRGEMKTLKDALSSTGIENH